MSVIDAYMDLPPEEPGSSIELADDETGLRTLEVSDIIDGQVIQRSFVVRCARQCIVCNLPDQERYTVERGVLRGRQYPAILADLPEDSAAWLEADGVTRVGDETARLRLSRHVRRRHSELEATAMRMLMEGFQAQAAVDLAGSQTIITDVGLLKEFQRRGFERMMECGDAPDVKETIKVTEILMAHQDVAGDSHVQVAAEGIRAFMAVAAKQLAPDTMQWIISALDGDPKVQALLRAAYEDIRG